MGNMCGGDDSPVYEKTRYPPRFSAYTASPPKSSWVPKLDNPPSTPPRSYSSVSPSQPSSQLQKNPSSTQPSLESNYKPVQVCDISERVENSSALKAMPITLNPTYIQPTTLSPLRTSTLHIDSSRQETRPAVITSEEKILYPRPYVSDSASARGSSQKTYTCTVVSSYPNTCAPSTAPIPSNLSSAQSGSTWQNPVPSVTASTEKILYPRPYVPHSSLRDVILKPPTSAVSVSYKSPTYASPVPATSLSQDKVVYPKPIVTSSVPSSAAPQKTYASPSVYPPVRITDYQSQYTNYYPSTSSITYASSYTASHKASSAFSTSAWQQSFSTIEEYKEHFLGLLAEENEVTVTALSEILENSVLREVSRRGQRTLYRLDVPSSSEFHNGDQFLLTSPTVSEQVSAFNLNECTNSMEFLSTHRGMTSIEYLQSLSNYRMTASLSTLSMDHPLAALLCTQQFLSKYVYDQRVPERYDGDLDEFQNEAIAAALKFKVTLIHGPPGTGKTTVAARVVKALVQAGETVLVCAPSNVAADNLALRIGEEGVDVVRLYSKSKEDGSNLGDSLAFHKELAALAAKRYPSCRNCPATRTSIQQRLTVIQFSSLCKELLNSKRVVCCTCATAFDPLLSEVEFRTTLIDEAAFCIEPEAMIAVTASGCKRLVLIGDPKQLRPLVQSDSARSSGLDKSLFERLESIGFESTMLAIQYRMHPVLSYYPRTQFYGGRLTDGVSAEDRSLEEYDVGVLFEISPLLFVNCKGREEQYKNTTSKCNSAEAKMVIDYLRQLIRLGVETSTIGVITSYEGQRNIIVESIGAHLGIRDGAIEVKNIDGYQGREKDFIIITCVRSNLNNGIGFLKDINRINVALTRAKYGLIVIGNEQTLRSDNVWSGFLDYVESEGMVIGSRKTKKANKRTKAPKANKPTKAPKANKPNKAPKANKPNKAEAMRRFKERQSKRGDT